VTGAAESTGTNSTGARLLEPNNGGKMQKLANFTVINVFHDKMMQSMRIVLFSKKCKQIEKMLPHMLEINSFFLTHHKFFSP
jgi:hypothetical protein